MFGQWRLNSSTKTLMLNAKAFGGFLTTHKAQTLETLHTRLGPINVDVGKWVANAVDCCVHELEFELLWTSHPTCLRKSLYTCEIDSLSPTRFLWMLLPQLAFRLLESCSLILWCTKTKIFSFFVLFRVVGVKYSTIKLMTM